MPAAPDLPGIFHHSGESFTLTEPVTYTTSDGDVIEVPPGYRTDFASVPGAFQWIYPPFGRYMYAAVIHDWLYVTYYDGRHSLPRAYCDRIFLEAMYNSGVGVLTRWPLYIAVRLGGWIPWDGKKVPENLPKGGKLPAHA